jgi:hypothetical protein
MKLRPTYRTMCLLSLTFNLFLLPLQSQTFKHTNYMDSADYVFGWKDDSLQKILDTHCYVNCEGAKQQSIAEMNACAQTAVVDEDIDGCKFRGFVELSLNFIYGLVVGGWWFSISTLANCIVCCVGLTELPGGHQAEFTHSPE